MPMMPPPACAVQAVLRQYCNALLARLPRTATGATSVPPPYVGIDWYIRVSEDEEKVRLTCTCFFLK